YCLTNIIYWCLRVSLFCSIMITRSHCSSLLFFFNDTATTEIYTLSLHDALPIFLSRPELSEGAAKDPEVQAPDPSPSSRLRMTRSEEHTSELQSHLNLVCRLLLEKKKNKTRNCQEIDTKKLLTV